METIVRKSPLNKIFFLTFLIAYGANVHAVDSTYGTSSVTKASKSDNSSQSLVSVTTGRAWVSGSSSVNQLGKYGTKGVPSVNNVPGARSGSSGWSDSSGSLWVFGGQIRNSSGVSGRINDLWQYNKQADTWTWVSGANVINQKGEYGSKGVASPTNVPGARSNAVSWTDVSGNFWLFGGVGYDSLGQSGNLNDLWKYDPQTQLWTWVAGSNFRNKPGVYGTMGVGSPDNTPGTRGYASGAIDSLGNLWLFGGLGNDESNNLGTLNDLWKYDTQSGNWVWVSGSNLRNQNGVYGDQGVADPSNVIGARYYSTLWVDAADNIWLFGGLAASGTSMFNDTWKYDTQSNMWVWMSGANSVNQYGNYGVKGVVDVGNIPGSRYGAVEWLDSAGRVMIFGGQGFNDTNLRGMLNDVWRYDPSNNSWVWLAGTNLLNQPGKYGTKKVASDNNVPGARFLSVLLVDETGMPWLFGGSGFDLTRGSGLLNDLWTMGLYD